MSSELGIALFGAVPGIFVFMEDFMKNTKVTLVPLTEDDREQFILDKSMGVQIRCYDGVR